MKRILFVDDEVRILEALQRMLRPCRKRWEMAFVNSGEEALGALAERPFDVIVSDMRMPGMDGVQLLTTVRNRYPGMIRIVLSGHFELAAAVRATPVAHQFLMKPCDADKLRDAIERACEYDSSVADDATRKVIASVGELPALPHTYSSLVAALREPEVSLDRVAAIIQSDIAVSAKVLQLVNSAFFGLSSEIATVSKAVAYLGVDVLQQLVLTVELFHSFDTDCCVPGFFVVDTQWHCRMVAAIAARLPVPKELAAATSVAALMHDVGKLLLATRLPDQFRRTASASVDQNRPLHLVERELTGTTHAEIGAALLGLWGLPASVVLGVARHHEGTVEKPGEIPDVALAVHIADALAQDLSPAPADKAGGREALDRLQSLGFAHLLPQWREVAAQTMGLICTESQVLGTLAYRGNRNQYAM